jgi:hypothetical protein
LASWPSRVSRSPSATSIIRRLRKLATGKTHLLRRA